MNDEELLGLGRRVADLRIAQGWKQTELAYEAGVSHRTLQRLEAGQAVRSDVLLRVLKCLGRLDGVLAALAPAGQSPYEQLADAGLKLADLGRQDVRPGADEPAGAATGPSRRRRVRRSSHSEDDRAGEVRAPRVQWPEDQQ